MTIALLKWVRRILVLCSASVINRCTLYIYLPFVFVCPHPEVFADGLPKIFWDKLRMTKFDKFSKTVLLTLYMKQASAISLRCGNLVSFP